jgi:hypothetical protein
LGVEFIEEIHGKKVFVIWNSVFVR